MIDMPWKEICSGIGMFLAIYCIIPYVIGIVKGYVRPHMFSWTIWGILAGIICAIQFTEGAGPAAWVTLFNSLACVVIAVLALRQGQQNITTTDCIAFAIALLAIPIWVILDNPLISVLVLTGIDAVSIYPTLRKAWIKPYDELPQMWILTVILFCFSVLAIEVYIPENYIYPSFLIFTNAVIALVVLGRRRVVKAEVQA